MADGFGAFHDRSEAGRLLAGSLRHLQVRDLLVLGLARGGVPVASEVALALGADLDVAVARKLGAPGHPEFGFGAIAPGALVLDSATVRALRLPLPQVERIRRRETEEMDRRIRQYRGVRPPPRIASRTVIVVDDGVATGVTAKAALRSLRAQAPAWLVYAAPVGPPESVRALEGEADEVIVLEQPDPFMAVGAWYRDFPQTSDDEVVRLLEAAPGSAPQMGLRPEWAGPSVGS